MEIVALVKSLDHVCCRYRLAAYRPFWAGAGINLTMQPLAEALSWRGSKGGSLGKADIVLLQRKLLPSWQLQRLRRQAKCLVFDFDDAVFLRDSYARGGLHHPRLLRRFAQTVRAADFVVAGNDFLAEHAARWTSPRQIQVIPTCLDLVRYPIARHEPQGEICQLVWIGSSSTLRGLTQIRPMLENLGRQLPSLRLKIICDRSLVLEKIPVQFCPWSTEKETVDLAGCDVGISWLPEDDWSRGKCGLKILQYMAAGLPVVANPVGVQAELVQHEVTGLLARTPEEWRQALDRLAGSPDLRRQMGARGRLQVQQRYDVPRGAELWRNTAFSQIEMTERNGPQRPGPLLNSILQ